MTNLSFLAIFSIANISVISVDENFSYFNLCKYKYLSKANAANSLISNATLIIVLLHIFKPSSWCYSAPVIWNSPEKIVLHYLKKRKEKKDSFNQATTVETCGDEKATW